MLCVKAGVLCSVCVCIVCVWCVHGAVHGACAFNPVLRGIFLFYVRSGYSFLTSTITARAFAFTARKGGEQAVDAVVRGDGEGVSTSTVYGVSRVVRIAFSTERFAYELRPGG